MSIGRDIPEPTKRLLRQEAAFGCCVCGNPFLTYHHIVPFALAQKHDPANMMVLCPNHHSQADEGALTESEQRRWKATSYNVVRRYVDGQLFTNEDLLAVETRRHLFIGAFRFIVDGADDFVLSGATGGRISLEESAIVGAQIVVNSNTGGIVVEAAPGFPRAGIVGGATPKERFSRGLEMYHELLRGRLAD